MARRTTRRASAPDEATTEAPAAVVPAEETTAVPTAATATDSAFDALMADLEDDAAEEEAEAAILGETEGASTVPAVQETKEPEPEVLTGEILEDDGLAHLPASTRMEIEEGRKALEKFAVSRDAE